MTASTPPLVVVNATSSRIRDAAPRERLLEAVQRGVVARTGLDPIVIAEVDAARMRDRVREELGENAGLDPAAGASDENRLVVVVGGDGTVRDVAHLIEGHPAVVAIVPIGTANLFAAAIGIPRRPERAAHAIETAVPRRVDLGRIRYGIAGTAGVVGEGAGARTEAGPVLFSVGAGLGFDARVMSATRATHKRRIGRYAYFLAAVRELPGVRPVSLRVIVDGTTLELDAFQVLVANSGELIPGVLRPARRIDPGDGMLDVFIVGGRGRMDALLGAGEAIVRRDMGRSRSGRSHRLRVRSIRVEAPAGSELEVDGDVVGSGWFEATCLPQALTVLTPASGTR
jgi:diacylglycerol kinase (ATP)